MRRRLLLALAALPLLTLPAAAHHGWGLYDADHPVTLTLPLDTVIFENPHAMAMITRDGAMWHVLLAPPARMESRGATPEIVKQGSQATIHAFPAKDDTHVLRADWIEINGTRYDLR